MGTGPPWILVEREIAKSRAFWALSGAAPLVLMAFLEKRRMQRVTARKTRGHRYQATNSRELVFTYAEAAKYGLTKSRFARAVDQLVKRGFIDIVHAGSGLQGDHSIYGLSERWRRYGEPNFEQRTRQKPGRRIGFCSPSRRKSLGSL